MDLDFWHQRWQRDEIGFHQPEVNLHLREHWPRVNLPAGKAAFVPLCGKSQDMLWLHSLGHPVVGVEVSPLAVEAFFTENGLSAEITKQKHHARWQHDSIGVLCGDYFELEPTDLAEVGAVYDRASLIALPPDLRRRYVEHLHHLLADRAEVLLVTLEYPEGGMEGPPFAVQESEVHDLYDDHFQVQRLAMRDVLADNPHLSSRGVASLTEKAYLLTPR